jgi:hypothetical protein
MPGFAFGYAVAGFVPNQGLRTKPGGAERDRTVDLLNAIQALSQLSYGPTGTVFVAKGGVHVNQTPIWVVFGEQPISRWEQSLGSSFRPPK